MPWIGGGKRSKALSRLSSYKKRTAEAKTSETYGICSNSNQVVSEGANIDDDMILKVVNAALRQREKCQFRLLKF